MAQMHPYDFVKQVLFVQEKTLLDFWPNDDKYKEVLMDANHMLQELQMLEDWRWLRKEHIFGMVHPKTNPTERIALKFDTDEFYKPSSLYGDGLRLYRHRIPCKYLEAVKNELDKSTGITDIESVIRNHAEEVYKESRLKTTYTFKDGTFPDTQTRQVVEDSDWETDVWETRDNVFSFGYDSSIAVITEGSLEDPSVEYTTTVNIGDAVVSNDGTGFIFCPNGPMGIELPSSSNQPNWYSKSVYLYYAQDNNLVMFGFSGEFTGDENGIEVPGSTIPAGWLHAGRFIKKIELKPQGEAEPVGSLKIRKANGTVELVAEVDNASYVNPELAKVDGRWVAESITRFMMPGGMVPAVVADDLVETYWDIDGDVAQWGAETETELIDIIETSYPFADFNLLDWIDWRNYIEVQYTSTGYKTHHYVRQTNGLFVDPPNHRNHSLGAEIYPDRIELNRELWPFEFGRIAIADMQLRLKPFHICSSSCQADKWTLTDDENNTVDENATNVVYASENDSPNWPHPCNKIQDPMLDTNAFDLVPDVNYLIYATAAIHSLGSPSAQARQMDIADKAQKLLSSMRTVNASASTPDYVDWDLPGYLNFI